MSWFCHSTIVLLVKYVCNYSGNTFSTLFAPESTEKLKRSQERKICGATKLVKKMEIEYLFFSI